MVDFLSKREGCLECAAYKARFSGVAQTTSSIYSQLTLININISLHILLIDLPIGIRKSVFNLNS